jgi:hypothetical protein
MIKDIFYCIDEINVAQYNILKQNIENYFFFQRYTQLIKLPLHMYVTCKADTWI